MDNKQVAALYVELAMMYQEDFPVACHTDPAINQQTQMVEKIQMGDLTKKDILTIEPVFVYGHVDIHRYLKPKKRFIWF